MDEEALNRTLRQFLKTVGVTSQREIELAIRKALSEGRLSGEERLPAKATVTVDVLGLSFTVEGAIALS